MAKEQLEQVKINDEYDNFLKLKYPLKRLEKEIAKIEKLGYIVASSPNGCQIWNGEQLLIDADFRSDDFYLNAIDAINSFWFDK